MRVLFQSPGLADFMGGAAISEASLASELQHSAEVTVLVDKSQLDQAFAKRHGLKSLYPYTAKQVFRAWRDKKHPLNELFQQADVFHLNGHWKWENYFFSRLCRRHKVPYILHPRGMLLIGHRKLFLKNLFNWMLGYSIVRNAAKVIALSHFETSQFKRYPLKKDKIEVIPNGVRVPTLAHTGGIRAPREYFLYLGRIEQRKNLIFLIRSYAEYLNLGGKSSLLLMGPVEHGYDHKLQKEIKTLGLESKVKLREPVYDDRKWIYMIKAKAVLYPTLAEPFGRVPFEALALGALPVIPADSGSCEYLQQFLPECVYRSQDQQSLAATLKHVESLSLHGKIAAGKQWVGEKLDWAWIKDSVLKVYQTV